MANKPISEIESKAWDFAKNAHIKQVRKFINKPYFDAHVQKVNGILKLYTTNEILLCAALLHDTIEDCFDDKDVGYHVLVENFGKRIANIVLELTSDKEEIKNDYSGNKGEYLLDKMVNMSNNALTVKLADRLQNIEDAFTASERFRNNYYNETKFILNNLIKNRNLNRIQAKLASEIMSKLKNINTIFKIKRYRDI